MKQVGRPPRSSKGEGGMVLEIARETWQEVANSAGIATGRWEIYQRPKKQTGGFTEYTEVMKESPNRVKFVNSVFTWKRRPQLLIANSKQVLKYGFSFDSQNAPSFLLRVVTFWLHKWHSCSFFPVPDRPTSKRPMVKPHVIWTGPLILSFVLCFSQTTCLTFPPFLSQNHFSKLLFNQLLFNQLRRKIQDLHIILPLVKKQLERANKRFKKTRRTKVKQPAYFLPPPQPSFL